MMLEQHKTIVDIIWLMIRSSVGCNNDLPFIKAAVMRYLVEQDETQKLKEVYTRTIEAIAKDKKIKQHMLVKLIDAKFKYWHPSFKTMSATGMTNYQALVGQTSKYLDWAYDNRLPRIIIAKVIIKLLEMMHNPVSISIQRVAIFTNERVDLTDGVYVNSKCNIGYIIYVDKVPCFMDNPNHIDDVSVISDYLTVLSQFIIYESCNLSHDESCALSRLDMTHYESSLLAGDGLCKCEYVKYVKLARAVGSLVFDRFTTDSRDIEFCHTKVQAFSDANTPIYYRADESSVYTTTVASLTNEVVRAISDVYGKK